MEEKLIEIISQFQEITPELWREAVVLQQVYGYVGTVVFSLALLGVILTLIVANTKLEPDWREPEPWIGLGIGAFFGAMSLAFLILETIPRIFVPSLFAIRHLIGD